MIDLYRSHVLLIDRPTYKIKRSDLQKTEGLSYDRQTDGRRGSSLAATSSIQCPLTFIQSPGRPSLFIYLLRLSGFQADQINGSPLKTHQAEHSGVAHGAMIHWSADKGRREEGIGYVLLFGHSLFLLPGALLRRGGGCMV